MPGRIRVIRIEAALPLREPEHRPVEPPASETQTPEEGKVEVLERIDVELGGRRRLIVEAVLFSSSLVWIPMQHRDLRLLSPGSSSTPRPILVSAADSPGWTQVTVKLNSRYNSP